MPKAIFLSLTLLLLAGCTAQSHLEDVQNNKGNRLTAGVVQRDIKVGMSASEVVALLGSPNIVTSEENQQETWVYDKVSTEKAYSESRGAASGLLVVGAWGSGASSTTQKTLTVIIKFNKDKKVRDIAYHQASF